MLGVGVTGLAAAAGYLLLVGQIDPTEATAAVSCGLLAALWYGAVRRRTGRRFALPPGGAAAAGRALAGLLPATARTGLLMARSLVRPMRGGTVDQRFNHGARHDTRAAGRRALTVLGLSLSPEVFALRTPEQQDLVVLHGLGRTEVRPDPDWPI